MSLYTTPYYTTSLYTTWYYITPNNCIKVTYAQNCINLIDNRHDMLYDKCK